MSRPRAVTYLLALAAYWILAAIVFASSVRAQHIRELRPELAVWIAMLIGIAVVVIGVLHAVDLVRLARTGGQLRLTTRVRWVVQDAIFAMWGSLVPDAVRSLREFGGGPET